MSRLLSFLGVLWISAVSAQLGSIIQNTGNGVVKELQAASDPLAKGAVFVGFGQCAMVKRIVGVAYDQYDGSEPDLSGLTIQFISRSVNLKYRLSDAHIELPRSNRINFTQPFKIYMHGFTDDPTKESYSNISNAFLLQDDVNIVALDASSLIRFLYLRSSTMVRFIGQELGMMLAALLDKGLHPSNIHLIGHSLGSHIAAFAGKTYQELTGEKVARISSLDPAGPCFADLNGTLRLSKDDAKFVDVIHTDAGVYGLDQAVGHVDFYPNSGSKQPQCLFQTCSHSRAWLLFAESVVNPEAFYGIKCNDWKSFQKGKCDFDDISIMGFGCPDTSRGKYYLQTNDYIPYGRGEDGLNYKDNEAYVDKVVSVFG